MPDLTQTMKLHILPDKEAAALFAETTERYSGACNYISEYVFNNGFVLNFMRLQEAIYQDVRETCKLKSQMTISALKTVTARYKTVKEQLLQNPYKYMGPDGEWCYITRTLEWLQHPVYFRRPQADLVRGRDYTFVDGGKMLSI